MGGIKRCPGCSLKQAEHTFGKLSKECCGPVRDDVPESARQEQDASLQDSSIQATLNSLLGAVKTLPAGLDEVKADNKNLRALVEKKKPADGTSVYPPMLSDGDDVAQVSKPVSAVALPELRAMAHLSPKADRLVAQLGLANSTASSSDSDDQGRRYKVRFVRRTRGHTRPPVSLSSLGMKPR